MSYVDDRSLLERAQHGDRRARERLVVRHLDEVRSIARRYRNLGLSVDDLEQEGAIGLLDSIDQYDASRGPEFDAYARFRVRRAIRNALTDKSRLIRLPKQIIERRRALDRADAQLTDANGMHPSAGELAEATGLPPDAVTELRGLVPVVVSLDQVATPDGSTLEALVADGASPNPELDASKREETALVDHAVAELPERQREIVSRHYGLGCEPEEIADVAAELHLSQQRARTIERDALFALRDRLERQLGRPPVRR
jgi:RNA polymerase sigma factor (sigma-70 family)